MFRRIYHQLQVVQEVLAHGTSTMGSGTLPPRKAGKRIHAQRVRLESFLSFRLGHQRYPCDEATTGSGALGGDATVSGRFLLQYFYMFPVRLFPLYHLGNGFLFGHDNGFFVHVTDFSFLSLRL